MVHRYFSRLMQTSFSPLLRRAWICRLLAGALLAFTMPTVPNAVVVPLDDEGMVRAARHIVVAVVISAQPHWNSAKTIITTEYTLAVEDQLLGQLPSSVRISVFGGRLDGETQGSSLTPHLTVGSRYVLFLNALDGPGLSPIVGVDLGAIRERSDGTIAPTAFGFGKETFERGRAASRSEERFVDFVERLRAFVREIPSEPPSPSRGERVEGGIPLPRRPYLDTTPSWDPAKTALPLVPPEPGFPPPPSPEVRSQGGIDEISRTLDEPPLSFPAFVHRRHPEPYIVFNQLPQGHAWAPHDQYMMSRWNAYGDIFRVLQQPTGEWAWFNDRFDVAGLVSDERMLQEFERTFSPQELAVTFFRWEGEGPIIEADICFNPDFDWTLDEEEGSRRQGAWGVDAVMLNALGYAWGLRPPAEEQNVSFDSIMNRRPKVVRLPRLATDDANAIRNAYPGLNRHDGRVTTYSTADDPVSNEPRYRLNWLSPDSAFPGDEFQFADRIAIENMGTDLLVAPQLDFYLTPKRLSWRDAEYVSTSFIGGSVPTFFTGYYTPPRMKAPLFIPPGKYYMATLLRDAADADSGDNGAWTDDGVRLTCHGWTWLTYPERDAISTFESRVGPEGVFRFQFFARPGVHYDFSTCSEELGSHSFDTALTIYDPAGRQVSFNNDACGTGSRIDDFVPVVEGWHELQLSPFGAPPGPDEYGAFGLSYADDARKVTGTVRYYRQAASEPPPEPVRVPEVNVSVTDVPGGTLSDSSASNADGAYELVELPRTTVRLAPWRQEPSPSPAVTPADALATVRAWLGALSLTATQRGAADASGDGVLGVDDASLVARYWLGRVGRLPIAERGSPPSDWGFLPADAEVVLESDAVVDFTAFLYGDVNGDWSGSSGGPSATGRASTESSQDSERSADISAGPDGVATLRVPEIPPARPDGHLLARRGGPGLPTVRRWDERERRLARRGSLACRGRVRGARRVRRRGDSDRRSACSSGVDADRGLVPAGAGGA